MHTRTLVPTISMVKFTKQSLLSYCDVVVCVNLYLLVLQSIRLASLMEILVVAFAEFVLFWYRCMLRIFGNSGLYLQSMCEAFCVIELNSLGWFIL
jgi:hypothetical protein